MTKDIPNFCFTNTVIEVNDKTLIVELEGATGLKNKIYTIPLDKIISVEYGKHHHYEKAYCICLTTVIDKNRISFDINTFSDFAQIQILSILEEYKCRKTCKKARYNEIFHYIKG